MDLYVDVWKTELRSLQDKEMQPQLYLATSFPHIYCSVTKD